MVGFRGLIIVWISVWVIGIHRGAEAISDSHQSLHYHDEPTLSTSQIREMRVRDIKRRLALKHGYSNEELARILDKAELIHALSFEEHKIRQAEKEETQRERTWTSIVVALAVGLLYFFSPLLRHLYDVASVNAIVYIDEKRYHWRRCFTELRTLEGCFGMVILTVIEMLQFWIMLSVLASWVVGYGSPIRRYFFPIPSIPIQPAAFLSSDPAISKGPLSRYGVNTGPILLGWFLRWLRSSCQGWIGRAMKRAMKRQRHEARANETAEERKARKQAKRAAKQFREEQAAASWPSEKPAPPFMEEVQVSNLPAVSPIDPIAKTMADTNDEEDEVVEDVGIDAAMDELD